jgi:hypothetical protein
MVGGAHADLLAHAFGAELLDQVDHAVPIDLHHGVALLTRNYITVVTINNNNFY